MGSRQVPDDGLEHAMDRLCLEHRVLRLIEGRCIRFESCILDGGPHAMHQDVTGRAWFRDPLA